MDGFLVLDILVNLWTAIETPYGESDFSKILNLVLHTLFSVPSILKIT